MRSWRSALDTIYHHNARRVPSTYTPKTETERALQESIKALEIQCRERVDLLSALRESRKESAEANGAKEGPATLVKGKHTVTTPPLASATTPGFIGGGTIPAVGYTDLSKPAAIPGRPPPSNKQNTDNVPLYDDGASYTPSPSELPALRVNSNSSEMARSRGSSPERERRKPMLTTLRNTDGKKSKKANPKKVTRPAASKAAGLAWGSNFRPSSGEKPVSDAAIASSRTAAIDSSLRREPEPRTSSGDEPLVARGIRYRRDSAGDRIPVAHWREPQHAPPSRSSPQPSPRKFPREPPPPPVHRTLPSSASEAPRSISAQEAAASVPKPSVKPKPVSLRSSLQPPPSPSNTSRSAGNSRSETPRQERDPNVSSNHRTKTTPRPVKPEQPTYISPSSGSEDVQKGVERMSLAAANGTSVPRRKAVPPKRRETPPSSEPESSDLRSTADEAEDEDEDDENADVERIMNKLPKGVDPQSAKQILNDIVVRGDEVHWNDIAGLDGAKKALKEAVVYPFLRPDLFSGLREPARGMLLFGPPGTGKTMLARAVATESKSTFFSVSASSLTSKWHGESEKLVRALFGLAKALAPSIIFVDEIDSLLSARSSSSEHEASRRSKTEFLVQWSDLQRAAAGREQSPRDKKEGDATRVLVLAATNMPWDIDEAARRRFVRRQYIPLPEHHVREQQIRTLLGHQHQELSDEDIEVLVHVTDGM